MFITRRPVKRQGAQIWASRGNFLNNETDSTSTVDILKTSECKKDLRSISPSTDEAVAINNNNDSEKGKHSDVKNITASKRLSDSVIKPSLVTTHSPTKTHLCTDEIDDLLEIVGGKLNKAPSKDSGLDQSPENVTCDTSLSSNYEQLPHDIALDESGFTVDTSLSESTIEEKSIPPCQLLPLSPMSPETEFYELNMSECQEKTFENGEILNPRSPFSLNLEGRGNFPLVQMVCRELLVTERSYVNDLNEVIEGYIKHLKKNYRNEEDIFDIFGNLEDIHKFNKEVLYEIEQCEVSENEIDPIKLANVFCEKTSGFNKHYTQYCTEYPEAACALSYLLQDPGVANFFWERQTSIGHALSLESYLLKPVQRILKYNLLLKDILKKYRGDEDGYKIINTAIDAMSDVAEYINEMKRLHENARQVDDILNNIIDIDEPVNRYATGKFVLENTFKVHGVRGDRTIILFEKLLIMGKKTEDKLMQYKDRMECSNMMLVESIHKEPLGFQLLRFDNQKDTYTIVAKTPEIKKEWTQQLKRLILENHMATIPQTARQAILGEEQIKSKYNSLPMQALDNTGTLRKQIPKGCKSPNIRDSVNMSTGVKRESNEKDSSKEAKRHLKPKDFLNEKKNRSNVTSPTGISAEKEKKEKMRWIRRHKHKPSLDSNLNIEANAEEDHHHDYISQDSLIKSRSLESLKDVMKLHDDIEFKTEESGDTHGSPESIIEETPHGTSDGSVRHRSRSTTNGPKHCSHTRRKIVSAISDVSESGEELLNSSEHSGYPSGCYSPDLSVDTDVITETPVRESFSDVVEERTSKSRKISDESNPHSPIKNLVNKVSTALQNSFHLYSGNSPTNSSTNSINPMFFSPTQNSTINTNSSKTATDSDVPPRSSVEDNDNDISMLIETENRDDITDLDAISESVTDTLSTVDELHPPKLDKSELSESDEHSWSTNVDAVFYKVNADLDSIAGSIESDTAKSNESGSDVNNTPTDSSTSIGIGAIEKVSDANQTTDELSGVVSPTENVEQVKQVADRIKEYKRLVDAEKRRHSWTQREPKSIHEMIESLDSIQSVDNTLSPTYSSLRRRFRSSRDYGTGRDVRSSLEICNETPRSVSPSRTRSFDTCLYDTPVVELDAKSGELLSQRQLVSPTKLDTTFETEIKCENERTSSSGKRESGSSYYEYAEACIRSPDLVSTADLLTAVSPKCLDGHLLAKHSSLDNVFYTEADDELSRSAKSSSLPVTLNRKEKKDNIERKSSDTTNVADKTPTSNEPEIDLSAYSNLLKEGESVAKRTEVYFRALKNFEQHKRKPVFQKPKTPSFTTCDFSPLIMCDNVSNSCRNDEPSQMTSVQESEVPQIGNKIDKIEEKANNNEKLKESSTKISENLNEGRKQSNETSNTCCSDITENVSLKEDINEKSNECIRDQYENNNRNFADDIREINLCQENIEQSNEKDIVCNEEEEVTHVDNDENNNEKNKLVETVNDENNEKILSERTNVLRIGSDVNNNEPNKVFHMGNDKTKVFRIGKETNVSEKKFFRFEKQKIKPYQFNNIEKRQPKENIEKIKLCRISGDDKTLRCRLDIVEKTKVSRQDEKISCHSESKPECDKMRISQQDSNAKTELNCEDKTSTSNSKCQSSHENETEKVNVEDKLINQRSKSVSILPQNGDQLISRPPSRFTTETYINLDKRSLKKSNSSPPDTCNIIPPSQEKENNESSTKDNETKVKTKINKTLINKKAPDIYERTLTTKRVTRSCSMPSVNGVSSNDGGCKEKSHKKREQIDQLKSNLDRCVVDESPRGRSKSSRNCSGNTPTYQRSTSLPRRKKNFLTVIATNPVIEEAKKSDKYVFRSPSIRNIQENHVNNRIKDYFVNLQKSSEISTSRPNLLLVDNSCSGSDSECSNEENENSLATNNNNNNSNDNISNNNENDNQDNVQIYRGTVRSMIKKYGQVNYVFD